MKIKKISFYILLLIYYMPLHSSEVPASFCTQIEEKGYIEFENQDFGNNNYQELYDSYNNFLIFIRENDDIQTILKKAEKDFLNNDKNKARFNKTKYKANSNLEIDGLPHYKFISGYIKFIESEYPILLENNIVARFLYNIQKLHKKSEKISQDILFNLKQKYKDIDKFFYDEDQELYIITKIIRYKLNLDGSFRTIGHYDHSAFTMLWDSNDEDYNTLVIAEDINKDYIDKLILPKRDYIKTEDKSSALIISGAACFHMPLKIKPLIHAVLPFKQEYRFSVVSFLVPMISYQTPKF